MALVPVAVLLPMCKLRPKQYVLVLRRGGGIPKRRTSMHGNACPGHNCCNSGLHRTRSAAYKNLAAHTGSPAQSLPRGSTHAPKRWPRKARTRASSGRELGQVAVSFDARAQQQVVWTPPCRYGQSPYTYTYTAYRILKCTGLATRHMSSSVPVGSYRSMMSG